MAAAPSPAGPNVEVLTSIMEGFPLDKRPAYPTVLIPYEQRLYSLPVSKMDVRVEFHVSTAFVKITGRWENVAAYKSDCMFALPLNGTVTKVNLRINDRAFDTAVIPNEDLSDVVDASGAAAAAASSAAAAPVNPYEEQQADIMSNQHYDHYIPNLFRLPIPEVEPGDELVISVVYLEPLYFADGKYNFTLPLGFGGNLIQEGKKLWDVLSIKCTINSVTDKTQFESQSHELRCLSKRFPCIELEAVNIGRVPAGVRHDEMADPAALPYCTPRQSVDFQLSYTMSSDEILPTLIKETLDVAPEPGADEGEEEGTFVLFVTPPSLNNADRFFSRNLIFLLDRSGSMNGEPFNEAVRALGAALEGLNPTDKFNVVSFDHRQEYYRRNLVPATRQNVKAATMWASSLQPERGGTDIKMPLEYALNALDQAGAEDARTLPFVVLLTDGCVENERDICQFASARQSKTRILTFGIGFYCNWYFLKMLAQIGRGFSDVVVYKERIFSQIVQLLSMAAIPVITNVSLEIPADVRDVELYPYPIPDLFMGAPLTISGKYRGRFPDVVTLCGLFADNDAFRMEVSVRTSEVIPVNKVFLKQRIDLLTSQAWLDESEELQEQIVDISCANSMPSPYTTMVAYESTRELKDELGTQSLLDNPDAPPSASAGAPRQAARGKKKWWRDKKKLAMIGGAHAVAIGAVAFSFGSTAATLANIPVIGGIDFGGDCCECCGDCEIAECLAC